MGRRCEQLIVDGAVINILRDQINITYLPYLRA